MVEKLKKEKKLFPFVAFIMLLAVYHLSFKGFVHDDALFVDNYSGLDFVSLLNILGMRFSTWTSRIIIEFVYFNIYRLPVYAVLAINILMAGLLYFSAYKLLTYKKNEDIKTRIAVLLLFVFSAYPPQNMLSAGLVATCANYLWSLALALFFLTSVQRYLHGEKISVWQYPFYIIALIYASNEEQTAAMLFGFLVCFITYGLVKKKKLTYLYISLGIVILGLILILVCPGNGLRYESETSYWFPAYKDYNIIDKLQLAVSVTINCIFCEYNPISLIFLGVLAYFTYKKSNNLICSLSAIFPFAVVLINRLNGLAVQINPRLSSLPFPSEGTGFEDIAAYLYYFIACLCTVINLNIIYGKSLKLLQNYTVLMAGLCSLMVMGFSPTVYASNNRTHIFLVFVLIYLTVSIITHIKENDGINDRGISTAIGIFSAYLCYTNILLLF